MHDYFEILGLSSDARAAEVRRAWARRVRRPHPDFPDPSAGDPLTSVAAPGSGVDRDVAVDFVDVSTFVDRMQAAFFADPR